jgi:hypothetical protein
MTEIQTIILYYYSNVYINYCRVVALVVYFARLPGLHQMVLLMSDVLVQYSWDLLVSGNFPLELFFVFSVLCSSCHIGHLLNSRILPEYVPDIYYLSHHHEQQNTKKKKQKKKKKKINLDSSRFFFIKL